MWRWIGFSLVLITEVLVGQTANLPHKGISCQHRYQADPHLSIHLVEIDPTIYRLTAARALNSGVGHETVSSIAKRRSALVAINGGFFSVGGATMEILRERFSLSGFPSAGTSRPSAGASFSMV